MDFVKSIDYAGMGLKAAKLATIAVPWIFPLIMVYVAYRLGMYIYTYAISNQIIGDANEWVVIIRNGKQVQAQ